MEQDPENIAIQVMIEAVKEQLLANQQAEVTLNNQIFSNQWQQIQDAINNLAAVQSMGRIYVENEKIINEIIARTLAQELDISEDNDWVAINNIANQCPFDGGNAVYVARDIIEYKNLDKYYDYNDCSGNSNARTTNTHPNHFDPEEQMEVKGNSLRNLLPLVINPLIVYPNPSDNVIIICGLGSCKSPVLQLLDISGNIVFEESSDNLINLYSLSVRDFASGLYTIKVFDKHAGSFTQKINILH